MAALKQRFRRNADPAYEQLLFKCGYVSIFVNEANRKEEVEERVREAVAVNP